MSEDDTARDFARRLTDCADVHHECPPSGIQRCLWLIARAAQLGVTIEMSDLVQWFAGEARPSEPIGKILAQVLETDAVWLCFGPRGYSRPRQPRHDIG